MAKKSTYSRRDILVPGLAAVSASIVPASIVRAAESASSLAGNGPLFEGIMQYAYIVPDLEEAMAAYTERLGIGPWFVSERFSPPGMLYRGEPTNADVTIGMTYSDNMNIELIQQRDDVPSVYKETLEKHGYGFHHWGVASIDFDEDLAAYLERGDEIAFEVGFNGGRIAYIDTTSHLPGMVELIEVTDGVRAAFSDMARTAREWDGEELIYTG